jgi:hypothetical protein
VLRPGDHVDERGFGHGRAAPGRRDLRPHRIPLFVLHDFDKAGFTILRTLQRDTRRYAFANQIEVIDLGLRLADVEAWNLESEAVQYDKSLESVRESLRRDGATEDEIKFLATHRVELNAFASDALIRWITAKLEQHGVQKVIPDDELLADGYRRQYQSAYLGQHFGELLERSREHINSIDIPSDLRERVAHRLREQPSLSWNDAVAEIARMQTWPDSDWCDEA